MPVHPYMVWFSDISTRAVPFLFDATVKGSALLLIALLAVWILRRQSAALRHRIWVLAALSLLALPAISPLLPKWDIPTVVPSALVFANGDEAGINKMLSPDQVSTLRRHLVRNREGVQGSPMPLPLPSSQINPTDSASAMTGSAGSHLLHEPAPEIQRIPWQAWAASLWLFGFIAALIPLLSGLWMVRKIYRTGTLVTDTRLLQVFRAACAQMGMKHRVLLLKTRRISVPLTCGFIKSCVLLPLEAESWSLEKQRLVLLHELIHIRKKDCLVHALGRLALAIHWFNPLSWLALKGILLEGEKACDDLVLCSGSKPLDYAACLLDIARSLSTSRPIHTAAITMAQKSNLEIRLRMILDATRKRAEPAWLTRMTTFLCAASLLTPLRFGYNSHVTGFQSF